MIIPVGYVAYEYPKYKMSYTGFHGGEDDIAPLAANMPLWGRGYSIPLEGLRSLDIPSVLLGPIGADAHKLTERVELRYSMDILPEVLGEFLSLAALEDDPRQERSPEK